MGHSVVCADNDEYKISQLQTGVSPIREEGLEELLHKGIETEHLRFTIDVKSAVSNAEFVFLCLPTPQTRDGKADTSIVFAVVEDIRQSLMANSILVNKSTVPIGTSQLLVALLQRDDVAVVANPEFLRQGTAVSDFLKPDRVVIGGETDAVMRVSWLYEPLGSPILTMRSESAEMLKYAANAFLATKLTFINAIADLCEVVGADVLDVASGLALDPRIGTGMLRAGPGWGGSCFPKDTRALLSTADEKNYEFALLRGVIETNDQRYERIAEKILLAAGKPDGEVTVCAWGLTFKAHTDDLRDSPAIRILQILTQRGAKVRAFDPGARISDAIFGWISIAESAIACADDADVIAVLTEWPEFAAIDPIEVKRVAPRSRIVDARNVLNRELWRSHGFEIMSIGR